MENYGYMKISDQIDEMDDYEKLFAVWYLMDFLADHVQKEVENLGENIDNPPPGLSAKTHAQAYCLALEDLKVVKRLRDTLCYDIF